MAQGLLQRMGVFRGLLCTDVGCHGFQRVGKPFGQPLVARCNRRINLGHNGRLGLDKAHQHIGVQRGLAQGALQAQGRIEALHHRRPPCQPRNRGQHRRLARSCPDRRGHRGLAQSWPRLDPAGQGTPQRGRLDGLGNVVIHARSKAALPVGIHGVGGHGDHRQVLQAWVLAQLPGGGLSVHHRHLHVHQHNVIRGLAQLVQSHLAVVRHIHHKPRIAQQLHSHDLVEFVVLHQQHACATNSHWQYIRRGRGRRCA